MKTVKSVYLENVIIPTIELGECHRCDEDNAVEYFRKKSRGDMYGKRIVTPVEKKHQGMNSDD
ncbi:hypothetical protein [Bacillus velezensis]|uniref:hypothetical protein n=1 Tax=Bacillus velezensis TaxID=492670 RepID=UPI00100A0A4C|nr:hypothetical protein [Bacillus velezensis]QAV91209.1 hypothetical protein ES966_02635 [Bacillus velezensis]